MLTEYCNVQGCSDVRDRHHALQGFCFCHHFNMIIWGLFNSYWDCFPENKREAILFKNTCILYNDLIPGFLLDIWVLWSQTKSLLEGLWGYKNSRISTPTSQLWRSKIWLLFHGLSVFTGYGGVESVPVNRSQRMLLCPTWRHFLHCIMIPLDNQLWEPNISHCFQKVRISEWWFLSQVFGWLQSIFNCYSGHDRMAKIAWKVTRVTVLEISISFHCNTKKEFLI